MKSVVKHNLLNRQNIFITLFIVLCIFAIIYPYSKIDILISERIQGINSTIFQNLMWFLSQIGNQPYMIFLVGIISTILLILKYRIEAVVSSLSAATSALTGSLVKMIVDRPRPESELVQVSVWLSDKSFPSNHVLVFTVYFGLLFYFILKNTKNNLKLSILSICLLLLIASIGISRIYLGAHWASDVLGGYLLGTLWLMLAIKIYNSYHGKR